MPVGQRSHDVVGERIARVRLDGLLHPLPEVVVGLLGARRADDREVLGQQPAHGECVERRDELLRREVAGGAEDDEDARVGPAPQPQALEERVRASSAQAPSRGLRELDRVAAELVAQRRDHLGGERLVLPRGEAREQRGGDHRGRHVLVDRLGDRPAAFAGVVDVAADRLEVRALPSRRRRTAARAATSARRSRTARCRRSRAGRGRTRTTSGSRSPRRTPASGRTRCRCGPSS